jgi:hypothetical protein
VSDCRAHRQGRAILLPRLGVALELRKLRNPRLIARTTLSIDEAICEHVVEVAFQLWPTMTEARIHVEHWHISPLTALGTGTVEQGLLLVEVCVTLLPPCEPDAEHRH